LPALLTLVAYVKRRRSCSPRELRGGKYMSANRRTHNSIAHLLNTGPGVLIADKTVSIRVLEQEGASAES
jgi:hypothetical protein